MALSLESTMKSSCPAIKGLARDAHAHIAHVREVRKRLLACWPGMWS